MFTCNMRIIYICGLRETSFFYMYKIFSQEDLELYVVIFMQRENKLQFGRDSPDQSP